MKKPDLNSQNDDTSGLKRLGGEASDTAGRGASAADGIAEAALPHLNGRFGPGSGMGILTLHASHPGLCGFAKFN